MFICRFLSVTKNIKRDCAFINITFLTWLRHVHMFKSTCLSKSKGNYTTAGKNCKYLTAVTSMNDSKNIKCKEMNMLIQLLAHDILFI